MASFTFLLAFVAVVATASTSEPSDCSTEVGVDAVTTSLLQMGHVEKQKVSTRQAAKEGIEESTSELVDGTDLVKGSELVNETANASVGLLKDEQHWEGSDSKRDKVVFIKLHKVGSTTMSDILRRRCDNYGFRCAGVPKGSVYISTVTPDGLKTMANEHAGEYDIWANHVVLDPERLDVLVPNNIKTAVFRNPLDRVISSFRHAASVFGPQAATRPIHVLQEGRWPMELCGIPDMWYGDASHCCGPVAGLAMSAQIPLKQFDKLDFVMLTEEMDMSLMMFRRLVGWDLADMLYLKLRDTKAGMTPAREAANKEVEDYLRGGNATITTQAGQNFFSNCVAGDEAKLYDMAKQKYKQQWDSFSTAEQEELHSELAVFQEALTTLGACCAEHTDDVYCLEQSELTETWFARHGGSVANPESLPFPMQANYEMPKAEKLAGLAHSMCKGQALKVLHQSSAWQKA